MIDMIENFDKLLKMGIEVIYQGVRYTKQDSLWHASSFVDKLQHVTIPEGVAYIDDFAFYASSIVTVTLPNTLRDVGVEAFAYCPQLVRVDLDRTCNLTVHSGAFASCQNLVEVNMQHAQKLTLEDKAFQRSGIRSVNCKGTFISRYVFADCDLLTEVTLEDCWLNDKGFFLNCKSLKKATLIGTGSLLHPRGLWNTECMFANCVKLADVKLPDVLETMGQDMFRNCKSLSTLTMPETLEKIKKGCISGM